MYILQIEHPVKSYDGWKKLFDSDPAGRLQSGVRQYRILRKADEPNLVIIDLEFDSRVQAEAMLAKLQPIWGRIQGDIIESPRGRIFEVAESKVY